MLTLDQIKEKMKDRRVRIVAKETGIHHQTIYGLLNGRANPEYATVKALSDYLEAQ